MATPQHSLGTLCWFECGTKDVPKAKEFYTSLFGWNAVDVPMPGDAGGNYTLLKVGEDDVAGLYALEGPMFEGVPPHWMTYVTVDKVEDFAERATKLGGKIITPPMEVPGTGKLAVLGDPTGATISIFELGEHRGGAQGTSQGHFAWSELATRDTDRAKSFYTELFNWKSKKGSDGAMEYTEFLVGDRPVAGMLEMGPQHGDAPPHWLPYVLVDDCDASTKKATSLGANVIVPPMDVEKVGRFSVFVDPTGATLAIIKMSFQ